MVISTRSKTGSLPPAAAKPSAPAPPIAKKPARSSKPSAKAAAAASAAASAAKPGKAGAAAAPKTLPSLSLLCDDGERRDVASLLTDDTPALLLFTYPRANTGGCTAQAQGLSAFADEAAALGYAVAGASYDAVKSQASWKAKHALKLRLLCDTLDAGLLKKLGAHKAPKSVKRSLFIAVRDADGKQARIVAAHVSVSPKDSIAIAQQYAREHPQKKGAAAAAAAPAADDDAPADAAPAAKDGEKKEKEEKDADGDAEMSNGKDKAEEKKEGGADDAAKNGDKEEAKEAENGAKRQGGDDKEEKN